MKRLVKRGNLIVLAVLVMPLVLISWSYAVELYQYPISPNYTELMTALAIRGLSIGVLIAAIPIIAIYMHRSRIHERKPLDNGEKAPRTGSQLRGRLKRVLSQTGREVRHLATEEIASQVQDVVQREVGGVADKILRDVAGGFTEQLLDVSQGAVSDAARNAAGELGSRIGSGIASSVTREISDAAGEATRGVTKKTLDATEGAIVGALRGRKAGKQVRAKETAEQTSEGEIRRHTRMPQRCFKCMIALDADTVTWISDSRVKCPSCGTVIAVGE